MLIMHLPYMTFSNFLFFCYELSFVAFVVVNIFGQSSNMISLSCKLTDLPSLPTYSGDCSSSGKATLTGADICLKHVTKETRLKAKIELQVLSKYTGGES